MSLIDNINADQQAVEQAQAALDAANQKLAEDQAKLSTLQPHINALDQLKTDLINAVSGLGEAVTSTIQPIKDSIDSQIEQIKSILLG